MAKTVARPFSVAIVSVLAFIAGVIDIMSGILLLLEPDSDVRASFGGTGGFLSAAIGSMILGLIIVMLAFGLWFGRPAARMIVTVLEAMSLIQSLFLAVANLGNPVGEWASVAVSAIVLILLWTRPATAYFESSEIAAR